LFLTLINDSITINCHKIKIPYYYSSGLKVKSQENGAIIAIAILEEAIEMIINY